MKHSNLKETNLVLRYQGYSLIWIPVTKFNPLWILFLMLLGKQEVDSKMVWIKIKQKAVIEGWRP